MADIRDAQFFERVAFLALALDHIVIEQFEEATLPHIDMLAGFRHGAPTVALLVLHIADVALYNVADPVVILRHFRKPAAAIEFAELVRTEHEQLRGDGAAD
jgi:hypothetical protein